MKKKFLAACFGLMLVCPFNRGLADEATMVKGFQLVCYCIPFDILTRFPLGTANVKEKYYYKVTVRDTGLTDGNDILSLIKQLNDNAEDNDNIVNVRLVCELIENGNLIATVCFGADRGNLIINGRSVSSDTDQLFNTIKKYLPVKIDSPF